LLAKASIAALITERQGERAKAARLSAQWVLERLEREAEAGDTGEPNATRVKALELIGKHVGMWRENNEDKGTPALNALVDAIRAARENA
jgi:hypothetical protein